jgi:glycine hydroxymethyltransferase
MWEALVEAGAEPVALRALRDSRGQPSYRPAMDTTSADPDERAAGEYLAQFPAAAEMSKAYFVGQHTLSEPEGVSDGLRGFAWTDPTEAALKRTPLYDEHVALGAKLVPFAGWEMPVWYSGVRGEHEAVRERAGLFDVGHMGTIEVAGPHAVHFLDLVSVNYVWRLKDGRSQYSALLDAEGKVLDDVIIYRRAWDRYLVVVNAANSAKDWAWLSAVNDNLVTLDTQRPWIKSLHPVTLRDLHDAASGSRQRIDLALQGPASRRILLSCVDDASFRRQVSRLRRSQFAEGHLGGIEVLVSRTGYTGEKVGYELYVHPEQSVALWRLLLDRGEAHGIQVCGLAARDSTRIEAGLPLYGHELAGPTAVSMTEAGFGSFVKYHKPFFVGRDPYKATNDEGSRRVVRFQVVERGARALRGGEPVANRRGRVIGHVTSSALVGEQQIGMALVEARYGEPETLLHIFPEARRAVSKAPSSLELGDTVALPVGAEVLTRFPDWS